MKQKIYQVDAFTKELFTGNPAAVCPLTEWPEDQLLQNIAMENNLAETAFYIPKNDHYEIRWFTPTVEVDLCGHATLATAFVLFHHEGHSGGSIEFFSPRSGKLSVSRKGELLSLDFPVDEFMETPVDENLLACFNLKPTSAYKGKTDQLLIFDSEEEISMASPNLEAISRLPGRGLIISAPGMKSDFVSRFFAPQSGIPEDPVTGSAHTTLTPYWAEQLGKKELSAIQLSARRGYLNCKLKGDRVEISGKGRLYMKGEILID